MQAAHSWSTKICDRGFSLRDLKDTVQNEGLAYSEGLELVESASVSSTPGVVPCRAECIA